MCTDMILNEGELQWLSESSDYSQYLLLYWKLVPFPCLELHLESDVLVLNEHHGLISLRQRQTI